MRKSVSAVLVCGEEIFVIKRQNHLRVFPGYHAFPGGKVDKREPEQTIPTVLQDYDSDLIKALIREIKEELGIELAQTKLQAACHLGVAITPEFNPYRFETHFFRLDLEQKPDMTLDEGEVAKGYWISPNHLIHEFNCGQVLAVPPTLTTIRAFATDPNVQLIDLHFKFNSKREVPLIETIKGVKQILPLSNTFPPANRTNCFLIGDPGREVLIDPSPKDREEYEKLKTTIKPFSLQGIFLTHHHPDHHEFAPDLARERKLPMSMSADTYQRIKRKHGDDYFKDIEILTVIREESLTLSEGYRVILYPVPGHDEGQMALVREDGAWALVGDLIQTVGTVVIGGDEGNMKKYFASLQTMIELDPRYIIPSHGIIIGGTNKLKQTLKHRQMREQQIKKLLMEGKNSEQILAVVYEGLEDYLRPYALETIGKHIEKIEAES